MNALHKIIRSWAKNYFRNPFEAIPRETRENANTDPLTRGVMTRIIRRAARRRQITRKTGAAVLLPILSNWGVDGLDLKV